jgi:nucleoside-diphosphate-sugar epimerase
MSQQDDLPDRIQNVEHLELLLSEPSASAVAALGQISGDVLVLGVGGKMGPTLARMIVRGSRAAGVQRRVIGVSRFSTPGLRDRLRDWGIETIAGELLEREFIQSLPETPNVVFMAGMKFGATGNESLTWAMNTHLPSLVCERFPRSRIVAFSTGNIYGMVPVDGKGSAEDDLPAPVGEYAMSCLGRERMFEHFSRQEGTPTSIIRLNYAIDMRYGVLVDLARKVWEESPIDLSMGYVNVIWQGDANAMTICSLADAASPPLVLNVSGPERLAVRDMCQQFAQRLGKQARFVGSEAQDALLSNGQRARERYGQPRVSVQRLIQWIAAWVEAGGASLDKPTHFQSRDGQF